MITPPDLSVCVVTRSRMASIRRHLRSLYDTCDPVDIEVIVVDNGSRDDTILMIEQEFPEVKIYENIKPEPLSVARNRAMRLAAGRYLSFWDDDTVFQSGCIKRLVDFMDDHPEVGIGGPKVCDKDGLIEPSARGFPGLLTLLAIHGGLGRLFDSLPGRQHYLLAGWDHQSTRKVDWLVGSALVIRREALAEIGFYDEGYGCLYEDIDYCRRARSPGWHVHYIHEAQITHNSPFRYDPWQLTNLPASAGETRHSFHHLSALCRYLIKALIFRTGLPK